MRFDRALRGLRDTSFIIASVWTGQYVFQRSGSEGLWILLMGIGIGSYIGIVVSHRIQGRNRRAS